MFIWVKLLLGSMTDVTFTIISLDQTVTNGVEQYLSRPRGYKTFFKLNSAEHEIYPAYKCLNANNCWHFNIY